MPTVLVVEDVEDIREMVAETLRLEGYDVLEAEHGQQALELIERAPEKPCLVLLDLMMPVMGGAEFLAVLEATGRLATLPVIVISAGGQAKDAPQAAHFLRKPPSHDLLMQLVREYCDEAVRATPAH
jgi:two-component system, chemotaxis family, chemotaxis protein CheY